MPISELPAATFLLPLLHSLNLSGSWVDDEETEMIEMMPMTLLEYLKAPALKILALGENWAESSNVTDNCITISVICVTVLLPPPRFDIIPPASHRRCLAGVIKSW
ncbi:hypothetical protein B0H14DRAFT_2694982 [Mycena olivaceomarginata]|nr:hypothetical protein B0H14DRAFT_2694982 [Mycena olivaceomarginata]